MPDLRDIILFFDRRDAMGQTREHATIDVIHSLCGLEIAVNVQLPSAGVVCLRCRRAAAVLRAAPLHAMPGPPVSVSALVHFLGEALTQIEGHTVAQQFYDAGSSGEFALGQRLQELQAGLKTLAARRLVALSLQLIKCRRSLRQLQALRQELLYGT